MTDPGSGSGIPELPPRPTRGCPRVPSAATASPLLPAAFTSLVSLEMSPSVPNPCQPSGPPRPFHLQQDESGDTAGRLGDPQTDPAGPRGGFLGCRGRRCRAGVSKRRAVIKGRGGSRRSRFPQMEAPRPQTRHNKAPSNYLAPAGAAGPVGGWRRPGTPLWARSAPGGWGGGVSGGRGSPP